MNTRHGVMTAGGSRVHPLRQRVAQRMEALQAVPDQVPIIERYTDLAAQMHRTSLAPRGDGYLWGCSCGEYGIVARSAAAKASLVAQQHVVDEAEKMYRALEADVPSEEASL